MELTFIEIGLSVIYTGHTKSSGESIIVDLNHPNGFLSEIISYPKIIDDKPHVLIRGVGDWVPISALHRPLDTWKPTDPAIPIFQI